MRWLYTLLFYLALPLVLLRLLWRARRAPAYARRWAERFGIFPAPTLPPGAIWVHAVSVGESIAAAPMIRALQERYPERAIVVTTTTPTGSAQVQKLFGDTVFHVYAPYDLPNCVDSFLRRIRPACLVIMETELWPNTVALCRRRGIPVLLANGRLSAKSAAGYRRIGALMRPLFRQLSAAVVQHADDGERMMALGLPADRCHVSGNIKFDLAISDDLRQRAAELKAAISASSQRVIWIAASTHRGEDEQILQAFLSARQALRAKEEAADLFLILVPRHPERFEEVAELCRNASLTLERRSGHASFAPEVDVLLGDSMGELLMLFGAADIAFVGGSLVPVGGHNLIEPAAWGLPILTGPHLFNFAEVSRLLDEAGALTISEDAAALSAALLQLLGDQDERKRMGEAARAVAEANRGALDRLLAILENFL